MRGDSKEQDESREDRNEHGLDGTRFLQRLGALGREHGIDI